MRTVLVTGSSGRVGAPLVDQLAASGWMPRRFDLDTGHDLRDEHAVATAVHGCEAIIHAGALAHDSAGSPAEIMATNVLGTWHVLLAAEQWGVSRVVYFSSGQVFGLADGEGTPAYLPVDDKHPLLAARPYGLSKRLAEEMCAAWTARTGVATVALRPVMILDDEGLSLLDERDAQYGAFVHVQDVVDATVRALEVELEGHHRVTLCGPGDFDTTNAQRLLGWKPTRYWPKSRRPRPLD